MLKGTNGYDVYNQSYANQYLYLDLNSYESFIAYNIQGVNHPSQKEKECKYC